MNILRNHDSTAGPTQVTDLLDALGELGADLGALAEHVDLEWPIPAEIETRRPVSQLIRIMNKAEETLGDPLVGLHAGANARPGGPLFYLMLSTSPVSEGLRQLSEFASVPLDAQSMTVEVRDGLVELTITLSDPQLSSHRHSVDYIVAANAQVLTRAIPRFQLLGVALPHEEVGPVGETARVFGCPVEFNAKRASLQFADATLNAAPAAANAAIAEQVRKFALLQREQKSTPTVADLVTNTIRQMVSTGRPAGRSVVAKRLKMSERTLQRRLEEESTSFSGLYDSVRAEIARALLGNRALKVETIAQSVGFAEIASFTKAFTRWSGESPTRYRKRIRAKAASEGAPSPA